MLLKEFGQTPLAKLNKLNNVLREHYGISLKTQFPSKKKLESLLENANMTLVKLRNSNKKFHLDPEYAKFLGLRDAVEIMISEGMYAESPHYMEMKHMISGSVRQLMDSGYTVDEAVAECMNRYRMDNRFAYDDDHVLPIVITAAKSYMDECGAMKTEAAAEFPSTDLSDILLREMAAEVGVDLADSTSYSAIEEKINNFARVSGKSRDAVVGFLNSLDEAALPLAIRAFGAKIAEANAFVKARRDAIRTGKKEFEVDGKTYTVTGDTSQEKMSEGKEPTEKKRCGKCGENTIVTTKKGWMCEKCDTKKVDEGTLKEAAAKWGLKSTAGIDAYLADVTHTPSESMFDDIINDMLVEEVDVEKAEVVMAVRALSDDIQDQIERIGRMMNEDVPAIADKIRGEMGIQAAQVFADNLTQMLNAHLEATKTVKAGFDEVVSSMGGEQLPVDAGLGDTSDFDAAPEMPEEEPSVDVNEPAAAGPEDEPLGREEI
jgi:ribosomal protein S27AE